MTDRSLAARPRVATVPVDDRAPTPGSRPLGPEPPLSPAPPVTPALLGAPPPTDRVRGWVVAIGLALVALVVRFVDLGRVTDGGTPVFDEKHYVPQAWQMLRNGGVEDNPGFELIVHPPLGKQLIAIGELLFGYDGFGWRASAAFTGVLAVLIIVRVARRLTRSTLLGAVAGVLLICDGLSHVQSRMGMLDAFAALFVLAAFATLVRDRDDVRERMALVVAQGRIGDTPYGPRLGWRWWRLATGVLLGLGCAVKWSGLYWLAAFAVLAVLWDLTARRSAGVERPVKGTIVRDLAPALWALALVPVLAYLSGWWAWFGSETAIDRYATGGPSFLPGALRALVFYSGHVLDFHAGLTTAVSGEHPWESKPWTWPMGLRPMLYYFASGEQVVGCGTNDCVSAVMLVGTPALWWPAFGVLGFAIWRVATRHDWRYAAVLVGYGAGIVPWFLNIDRQMYFFYMAPVVPFLVLGTVLVMGEILGRADAPRERRQTGILLVGLWVGLVVANFAWMWPIMNGLPITQEMWDAQLWLPSWRAKG
ncbi:phospholipid carrier-dependent glycosyltransferase [Pseudonocardia petroleophila]|uniref:Polyprenol-phosphate-mannose--protein mannosyltransferase n=1 Tax=Pseudonocardia petroleophila TaxID=37331 RepID=A0A7G7MKE6_9PSEU|nr:phospholipid carrier-dependent glycosyltransferase [Pseudonocardia petroleophila]